MKYTMANVSLKSSTLISKDPWRCMGSEAYYHCTQLAENRARMITTPGKAVIQHAMRLYRVKYILYQVTLLSTSKAPSFHATALLILLRQLATRAQHMSVLEHDERNQTQ